MKRALCLDVGEKRIGVAVSDALGLTAQGVQTIFTKGDVRDREAVVDLLKQYDTDIIVSGLPKNLDGSEGFQSERVKAFVEPFKAMGYTVFYQDERMTTMSAHRTLIEADVRREKRKLVVDKLAATYILQAFLDSGKLAALTKKKIYLCEVYRPMSEDMELDQVMTLVDEDGNEVEFSLVMALEHKGDKFILLTPVTEMEDVDEDELVVLKLDTDDEGNDVYVGIEDEKLLEEVYNAYLEIAEADED